MKCRGDDALPPKGEGQSEVAPIVHKVIFSAPPCTSDDLKVFVEGVWLCHLIKACGLLIIIRGEDVDLVSPGSPCANVGAPPPLIEVLVVSLGFFGVMRHGTKSAEKVGVDKFPSTLPLKVFVVQIVILVKEGKVLGQFARGGEVINVDVGFGWSDALVVVRMRPHYDGQNVVSEKIMELYRTVFVGCH